MKMLIVHRVDIDKHLTKGIANKIDGIAFGFKENGYTVDILCNSKNGPVLNGELIHKKQFLGSSDIVFSLILPVIQNQNYSLIYIRFSPLSFTLYHNMRVVKAKYPEIKIMVEFPNYPFLYEFSIWKRLALHFFISKEWLKMKGWADAILHLGPEKNIYDVKTIKFDNGIVADQYALKQGIETDINIIHFIYVGTIWKWQGFDELLSQIAAYLKKQKLVKIYVTIVGNGPETQSLRKKVADLNLVNEITFLPNMYGSDLDALFEVADIGIGTLNNSKRKLSYAANLKHRQYAARGLAFFTNVPDYSFANVDEVICQEIIDIEAIVNWYQMTIFPRKKESATLLRKHAVDHLSWPKIIGTVLSDFKTIVQ